MQKGQDDPCDLCEISVLRPNGYSADVRKRVSLTVSDNVLSVFSSGVMARLLKNVCTFLMSSVGQSITGSMRGRVVILQDAMIRQAVDARTN